MIILKSYGIGYLIHFYRKLQSYKICCGGPRPNRLS